MSVRVKYRKNGFIGFASEKVAEILEKRGEVEILSIDEVRAESSLAEVRRPGKAKADQEAKQEAKA